MKIQKLIAPILITMLMFSTAVFADDDDDSSPASTEPVRQLVIAKEDPVRMLQSLKDKVQQAESGNKISQAYAKSLNELIDQKIILFERISNTLPIQEIKYDTSSDDEDSEPTPLGNMTLDQKQSQAIRDVISYIDDMKEAGLLSSSEAMSYVNSYRASINQWDGKGYPEFYIKQIRQFTDKVMIILSNEL